MKRTVSFLMILIADIFSLILSFHAAYLLRTEIIPYIYPIQNPWFFPIEHFYKMYYLLAVFILIFYYEKLYTRRYDFFEEFIYVVRGLFTSIILIAMLIYLSRTYEIFSRTIPLLMMLTGMIIVPLVRYIVKRVLIISGFYTKNAAVIGKPKRTKEVLPTLKKLEKSGWNIVHVWDWENGCLPEDVEQFFFRPRENDPGNENGNDKDNAGFRPPPGEAIETLIIVPKGIEKKSLNRLINRCEGHVKEIKIVSDSTYLKTMGVETEYIEELLVMRMANNLLSPVNRILKRGFDLAASLAGLIVNLPLFLLVAVGIKLDSRGPVLFVQERFGKDGKKFKLIKFRTMYTDADERLKEHLGQNPEQQKEWEQYKKLKSGDPRITPFGRFLRRLSLDEVPQLYNVFKGDMSVVGPRPYLPREKEDIEKYASIIFRVKSGLTGLWQIKGRNELSFKTRLKLDEFYVRNWSFLLDITIILKTFGAVVRGKGAY